MKTGSLPVSYTDTGLLFADGSHLKADILVFATGFVGNLRDIVRQMFGDKVADRAGDCWGVDDEGEIKGAFKPLGRMLYPSLPTEFLVLMMFIEPGLWYIGGGINHARFYSRFIAMQIKAALEGKSFPVFHGNEQDTRPKL
jgi:hypothetical protein